MTRAIRDRTPSTTLLKLTPTHRTEIEMACALVRRSWTPLLRVQRRDFPLPTLGPVLARVARDLDHVPGHLVVRGVPTGGPAPDLRRVLWGIGRHLGVAVPQDTTGHLVLEPGSGDQAFRTGGSDVTALLAVTGEEVVGLVSTRDLYAAIGRSRPELAELLFAPLPFSVAGESGYRLLPLACRSGDSFSLRYDRDAIERAQWQPGAPLLAPPHRELLDLVDALLPELAHAVTLEAGDLLLVNNHEVLHCLESCSPRMLRLWLTLREGRALPHSYLWPTPTYGETGGRGGVTPRDVIDPHP